MKNYNFNIQLQYELTQAVVKKHYQNSSFWSTQFHQEDG